jgi:hypothetical protein
MEFKIHVNKNNKYYSYYFQVDIIRNSAVIDKIDNLYFNEENKIHNSYVINKYILEKFNVDCKDHFREERKSVSRMLIDPPYGLKEVARHALFNIYYNLLSKEFDDDGFKVFLSIITLPNIDNESAYYIASENAGWFCGAMREMLSSNVYAPHSRHLRDDNKADEFCDDYASGTLSGAIVVTMDYYFETEVEFQSMKFDPYETLKSEEFRDYLEENKSLLNDDSFDEILYSFKEYKKKNLEVDPTIESYVQYIKNCSKKYMGELKSEDVKDLLFTHSDLIKGLKRSTIHAKSQESL